MSIAAVIMMRERRLVERFRSAGATEPGSARSLSEIGADDGLALRRLQRRAVLRETTGGGYYLDEPSWSAVRGMRRRVIAIVVVISVVALIYGLSASAR